MDQLSVSAIKGELQKHQQGRIGLTIFDRVLYLLQSAKLIIFSLIIQTFLNGLLSTIFILMMDN